MFKNDGEDIIKFGNNLEDFEYLDVLEKTADYINKYKIIAAFNQVFKLSDVDRKVVFSVCRKDSGWEPVREHSYASIDNYDDLPFIRKQKRIDSPHKLIYSKSFFQDPSNVEPREALLYKDITVRIITLSNLTIKLLLTHKRMLSFDLPFRHKLGNWWMRLYVTFPDNNTIMNRVIDAFQQAENDILNYVYFDKIHDYTHVTKSLSMVHDNQTLFVKRTFALDKRRCAFLMMSIMRKFGTAFLMSTFNYFVDTFFSLRIENNEIVSFKKFDEELCFSPKFVEKTRKFVLNHPKLDADGFKIRPLELFQFNHEGICSPPIEAELVSKVKRKSTGWRSSFYKKPEKSFLRYYC